MNDMATLIGGTLIDPEIGMSLETSEADVMGTAKKMIVSKDDSIVIGGMGDEAMIKNRIENISCLLYTSPSPRDKRQSRMPSSA